MPSETEKMHNDRGATHGDWETQARLGAKLKEMLHIHNYKKLSVPAQETLKMIMWKISRILVGDFTEPDHWDDIAGYAKLEAARLRERANSRSH